MTIIIKNKTSKIELEDSLKSIQTKEKNENYPKEIKIEI